MSTVQVRYVGSKARRQDTVAGTGIWWEGKGDVQPVPLKAWGTMAKHPDVWELADAASASVVDSAIGLTRVSAAVSAIVAASAPAAVAPTLEPVLDGTGHPDVIVIADGMSMPREKVVRDAFLALVFGAKEWNELTDDQRAELVDAHIERMREAPVVISDKPQADFAAIQPPAAVVALPPAPAPEPAPAPAAAQVAKPTPEAEAINADSTAPKKGARGKQKAA